MSQNYGKIIEGNWDSLVGKMKQQWGKLTDDDIKKLEGSYHNLVGKLKKIYGYKEAEIEQQVSDFIKDAGLSNLKEKAEAMWENALDVKDKVKTTLQDSAHVIKEKSGIAQDNFITYVKENPCKSVGFALLTGLVAGKLFLHKSN